MTAASTVYKRHPKYWETETRCCVFAVQNTLYYFPLATLTMMSPPLTAIFEIPASIPVVGGDGTAAPMEGTEENPIVLPGLTVQQLDDYLSFFFKSALIQPSSLDPDRREEYAVNLLTVGDLWDIDEAKLAAKEILVDLKLPAAKRLQFAHRFAIHDWVKDAVMTLIPECGVLTGTEALLIGPTTLNILFSAKSALLHERMCVAHTPAKLAKKEDLNYGDCRDHQSCEKAVKDHWFRLVGRKILHPKTPLPLEKITEYINKLEFRGITPRCHDDMVARWTTNTFAHDAIIEGAVLAVIEFHNCCRMI